MFGYINVNGKELSVENKEKYQSYYCGLCQTLKKDVGKRGQILLNYDMTFLVVLLTGLYEPESLDKEFTCGLHPFKKKNLTINQFTEYAAAMNLMLAYYNLIDDWVDDNNLGKKALANLIHSDYERYSLRYSRQAEAIENYIFRLSELENTEESNIDLLAGLTGEMLGELFAYRQDEWYDELKNLGFYMGKFIYLMDAYEDLDKDEKHFDFNPLIAFRKAHQDDYESLVKLMMTSYMAEAAKAFERLPILENSEILRNILYSGVWSKYEYLGLKKKKKEEQIRKKAEKS